MTFLKADDRFYIPNIRISVKDTSAAQARAKAILQGQRKAFKVLIEQLVSPEDQGSLLELTDTQLNEMVQDVEVQNEKNSTVRYIGTFAFRFHPAKVQEFLTHKEKKALPALSNEKILVIPIYIEKGKVFLWEEDNPWRQAWSQNTDLKSQYILPLGDLTDITEFSRQAALRKDNTSIQALRKRYQTGQILLAILKEDSPFELDLHLYNADGLTYSEESIVLLGETKFTPFLAHKAIRKALENVESVASENRLSEIQGEASFESRIMFQNHREWIKIQKIFSKIPLIRKIEILSLRRTQAHVSVHYLGTEKRIMHALEKEGLNVSADPKQPIHKIIEGRFNEKTSRENFLENIEVIR